MPKLVDFNISTENSNELGDTFNNSYLEAITKGKNIIIMNLFNQNNIYK